MGSSSFSHTIIYRNNSAIRSILNRRYQQIHVICLPCQLHSIPTWINLWTISNPPTCFEGSVVKQEARSAELAVSTPWLTEKQYYSLLPVIITNIHASERESKQTLLLNWTLGHNILPQTTCLYRIVWTVDLAIHVKYRDIKLIVITLTMQDANRDNWNTQLLLKTNDLILCF